MWQKVEQEVLEPIRGMVWVEKSQQAVTKTSKRWLQILNQSIFNWRMLLFGIGFLLGRAMILAEMSPFALPFAASVFVLRKERTGIAVFAILAGAMSHQPMNALFFISALLVYASLQKGADLFIKNRMQSLPLLVFGSSLITRTVFSMFGEGGLERVDTMLALVEGGLSLVLTLIFLQSIPLLTNKKIPQSLKNEEIVCLMILLASVMTGTIGWQINDVAVEHVVSRYLVLLFAFVGGAAIGSTVGVVTGLILSLAQVASLSQMSLLAFSGLLGGLLKEGKRFGVSLGLIIGTVMIGLYGEGRSEITSTLMESGFAVLLFLLTPKTAISNISKYVPGTREHSMHQQQYLKKIRDVTASRVERFSSLFQALSHSFQSVGSSLNEEDSTREVDLFLSNITEKTCQTCFKKEQCWAQNFTTTYDLMTRLMVEQEDYSDIKDRKLKREWEKHCIKPEKITDLMKKELTQYRASQKLKIQVQESRRLVADQLMGVSQVMGDFAKEIQREQANHQIQEEQIKDSLAQAGIDIGHVDIYSLETSNVDIEMTIPSCNGSGIAEKLIAPILSDILEETILVTHEDCANYPTGFCHLSFHSAREYVVETGIASAAKGGAWLSGDSHSTIEIGAGKFAVAIADGMGNGERAFIESNETLQLLQKILQSGIEEEVAIKSVNSVLSLRTTDEIFSTLDLAMIDLQDASAKFLKIGSTPSFIKRGDQIKTVEASNLPMGIIRDFDVDVVDEQLKAGDILIMMSDGIYEAPRHIENIDAWLKRKIREIDTEDPQEIADIIMEEVIRSGNNGIEDDMTVAVTKIEKNIPKWATVPQYPKVAINRKKAQ
ncbi:MULTISPECIES: stage II sporulation protein E [Fictibacillus]|uniref:stage II sporulation protein E n=1 Tax=Fictibacillus TaxID=1329200 RepID=UPI0018CEC8C0|nr:MULTISPECIES: stage II sporulation protein E [unclassified Fictibacillus]MBH0158989.1 stage II sporulation protein E [Fictibacillus sp. 5RED26]MBH0163160.1 stage II sporulation protein E [Fictibacillus sp. 26RED30]MBH0167531.1 stage II sporulation protein E [Fictibacillus sp. 7GRE50]MBH0176101.1 stage II sporulation protein E [Fictibacillus sp. 23RED33]